MTSLRRRILAATAAVLSAAAVIGWAALPAASAPPSPGRYVGAWLGSFDGAHFAPHAIVLGPLDPATGHGTMWSFNPANVQKDQGVSDAAGVGTWSPGPHGTVVFTFREINAVWGTNTLAPQLEVAGRLSLGHDQAGELLTGTALAHVDGDPFDAAHEFAATFTGGRRSGIDPLLLAAVPAP